MGVTQRTVAKSFRITNTHYNLLARDKYKPSAIVRVLLQLYFNKRIPGINALIEAEEKVIENMTEKNLLKFKEMLQTNNPKRKRAENGNSASSI